VSPLLVWCSCTAMSETHEIVYGGRFYLKLGYELVPSQEGEYYALDIDRFLGE
jgi:hypothetical protein